MGDDSEWVKLPTEEKVVHKAWKARQAGYDEALKLFSTLDEKDAQFLTYQDLIKKFVVDNNAIAQERALDAVLAFVETAQVAKRNAGEILGLIVNKCLNAARAKTRERAFDVIMMYVEIDRPDVVEEELLKGLENKQPKIVSSCAQCLRMALEAFGPKVVQLKPIVKVLGKLLEDRDKTVRDETKLLVVEIYKWIGVALKPQLASLKPVQIQELEAEFEKLPPVKPVQMRYMRSQQDLKAKAEATTVTASSNGSGEPGDDVSSSTGVDIDPFDIIEAVEILSKLPKDFYEQVDAKKWQDRKEALDACQKLTDNPKLDPTSDYGELVRALCKVVAKDSNVMLVVIGAKCLFGLATGLRKKFFPYALTCIKVFLEKFKEKKANVVTALREAVDITYQSTTLEAICEDTIAALNDKNPSVRSETAAFLARCCFARCTPATLPKKLLKAFCDVLMKTVNDMSLEVREASFQALGTAMKVVSEKAITPFLSDLDAIKMAKIKECCDKAELVFMKSKTAAVPAAAAPAVAAASKPTVSSDRGKAAPPPAASKKADGTKTSGGAATKATKAGPSAKTGASKAKGGAAKGASEALASEAVLSPDVAEEKAKTLLSEDVVNALANSNWKDRLSAMETVLQKVKGTPRDELPTQAIVYIIGSKKPGLKDTNFQVLKMRLDAITHLAQNFTFTKTSAECVLADIVDKVGDAKNGDGAKEALTAIAEATDMSFVSQEVMQLAIDQQKNPKNQAESLQWLAQALKEFGFRVNVKPMISYLKKALQAPNPAVRTAAIAGVLPVMYTYMGTTLRTLFEDEKPALLQQIDAEFDKVKGEKPPPPTRGIKHVAAGAGNDGGESDDAMDGADAAASVADLIPRTDISGKITEALLGKLADKNWKVRKEGLDEVVAILNEAKFITADIGSLGEALKLRLNDSNKILVSTALAICQTLAVACGPSVRRHVSCLAGAIISNMGDSKPQLRQTVMDTLNAWVQEVKLAPFVEDAIFSDAIKLENPNLRSALLSWLALKLPLEKKLPSEPLRECLPPLFACLGDRNPEVRKSAQECLQPFMQHTGFDAMLKAANKLDRGSKDQTMPLLEKAKEAMLSQQKQMQPTAAAKPPAAKVVQPAPAVVDKPSTASSSRVAVDDAEADEGSGSKAKAPAAAAAKGKPLTQPSTATKKKGQEEDTSPLMAINTTKAQRVKDEKALKVLKWNFTLPRQEFVDQLKEQMEKNMSASAMELLFHTDFQRHTKAITLMHAALDSLKEAVVDNLDLILKWMTLRFFDTNPSMLNKALEFVQALFRMLGDDGYRMADSEASSFVPYLLLKVGDSKDNVRRDVRVILKLICKVYPASKMFNFIITGVISKNAKQRAECLEELGWLIEMYGAGVCQPTPAQALKEIARSISDSDNKVRMAALNAIVAAHSLIGETVYKFVGQLNEKDMSMLEERIKRAIKKPAVGGAVAPPEKDRSPEKERPATADAQSSRPLAAKSVESLPAAVAAGVGLRRPATAAGTGTARPPEFTLGLEYGALVRPEDPRLIDHGDLEALLREPEPVYHPRLRNAISQQHLATSPPAARLGGVTADITVAVDLVISQVTSSDPATAIAALAQIDTTLKSGARGELVSGHVDQLLLLSTLQLKKAFNKHFADASISKELVFRLYRCLGATILSLFDRPALAREATSDTLKDLVNTLIQVVLDARLEQYEEGVQVVRSINVVIVRIIDHASSSNMMSALIRLLHDCVGNAACGPKHTELVMKCLWKMTRKIADIAGSLQVDSILLDVSAFLTAYPINSWKDRANDTPLRTVKTLVHTIAKAIGPSKVLSSMSVLESSAAASAGSSELLTFLQRLVRHNSGHQSSNDDKGVSGTADPQTVRSDQAPLGSLNGTKSSTLNPTEKKAPRRLSKDVHDALAEIFKKIGSKENTKEGLNDLYDFRMKHPDADLEPFIRKSSQFFQTYIERGLKNIELERQDKGKQSEAPLNVTVAARPGRQTADASADPETAAYRERLQKLLERSSGNSTAGTTAAAGRSAGVTSATTVRSGSSVSIDSLQDYKTTLSGDASGGSTNARHLQPTSAITTVKTTAKPVAPDVSDLKARLDRIKAAKAT